jgi:uncharacterized protein
MSGAMVLSRAERSGRAVVLALMLAAPTPLLAETAPTCGGHDLAERAAAFPQALKSAEAARRDWLVNGQGLLWRIDKPGVAPSYLFGTIHATDERAIALAREAATNVRGAKVVATELGGPLDKSMVAEIGANLMVKAVARDVDTFAPIASPEDRATVEKFLAERGINAALAHHLKLWFLAAATVEPPCEIQRQSMDLPVVDNLIAETAKDLGVKVAAIETMEEQSDILSSVDPSLAATLLVSAATKPALNDDVYATLLDFYAQKRPVETLPVIDASGVLTKKEIDAEDEFSVHLLGGRNGLMAERIQPMIDDGGAFIAVGALHLSGKGGLVALLRERGLTLTPLW